MNFWSPDTKQKSVMWKSDTRCVIINEYVCILLSPHRRPWSLFDMMNPRTGRPIFESSSETSTKEREELMKSIQPHHPAVSTMLPLSFICNWIQCVIVARRCRAHNFKVWKRFAERFPARKQMDGYSESTLHWLSSRKSSPSDKMPKLRIYGVHPNASNCELGFSSTW